jgi:hypothetical protein
MTMCGFAKGLSSDTWLRRSGTEEAVFFGGPLAIDYEAEPAAWLKEYLPYSVRGWTPSDPKNPFQGEDRFLGANFGAFVEDVLEVGGFSSQHGPGALHAGTEGNPTGLEHQLQEQMLRKGYAPVYVEGAVVWHFVPRERCTEDWTLHRKYRMAFSRTLRREELNPGRGPRLWRVPLQMWLLYILVRIIAMLAPLNPNPVGRFHWVLNLHKVRGKIRGHQSVVVK